MSTSVQVHWELDAGNVCLKIKDMIFQNGLSATDITLDYAVVLVNKHAQLTLTLE